MKYIRTKNEVFEYNPLLNVSVYKDTIQADTIEELCDFVDIQYFDNSWETYNYEESFKIKLLFKKAKQVFYGIRTEKGLIYVAKMNDKGELELL